MAVICRIRKVSTTGIITTIAGNGTAGFSGDAGLATMAKLNSPSDVKIDKYGNVYIGDANNYRIRKISTAGIITTIAGNGISGFGGDGGMATDAQIMGTNIAIDTNSNLFISDNTRIREIAPTGEIFTIAGNGTAGFSGDSGNPILAEFNVATGIALNGDCKLYVADCFNSRLRYITGAPFIAPITGTSIIHLGTAYSYSNATPGGTWSSSNPTIATINSMGTITPIAVGNDTIRYTVTNSCGSSYVTMPILITFSPNLPCYMPSSGLIAWYPFSGNTIDSSGNGNNGINYGATLTTDRFGNPNSAYNFNGTNNFIAIHDNPTLRPSDSLTICAWVWIDTTIGNSFSGIVDKPVNEPSSFSSYQLITGNAGLGQQGDPGMTTITSSGYVWTADVTHSYCNQWMYVVGTYDGTNMRCYQNGILVATVPQTGSIIYSPDSVTIGIRLGTYSGYGIDAFKGKIDDIVIYNRALTTCEVSKLYSASCGLPSIIGLSTVCMGDSIILSDIAGGGAWNSLNGHATVSGGVVTGVTSGVDTIKYTITNSCGSDTASQAVTINPLPSAGTISGSSTVCATATTTLTDTATGGTWSVSNAHASVSSSGVVTGVSSGVDTAFYTVFNSCGSDTASQVITINSCSTGISNTENNYELKISPNPNYGAFYITGVIDCASNTSVNIELGNTLGQIIYENNIKCYDGKLNTEISLTYAPKGLYILTLRYANLIKQYKVIID